MFDAIRSTTQSRQLKAPTAAKLQQQARQMKSAALFDGAQELRIDHHGQEYRLRETRNGKLILTK